MLRYRTGSRAPGVATLIVNRLLILAGGCIVVATTALGQTGDASVLLARLKDGRERIWSYQGSGHLARSFVTSKGADDERVDFIAAGNHLTDQFRFDVVRHSAASSTGSASTSSAGSRSALDSGPSAETKQIWKSNGVTVWSDEGGAKSLVQIVAPDRVTSLYKPFDVRTVGFVADGDLIGFTRFEKAWQTYLQSAKIKHYSSDQDSHEVVVESEVRHARGTAPLTIWMTLNESMDCVPVKTTIYAGHSYEQVQTNRYGSIHSTRLSRSGLVWLNVGFRMHAGLCETQGVPAKKSMNLHSRGRRLT